MTYRKTMTRIGLGSGFISISPLCLITKACTHINWINIMTIRIKKVIRIDQWIVCIFVWKLFKRLELRDKINVIWRNRVITRKIMSPLRLRKILQVSKLYIIFGTILRLLKVPTAPQYWAKLTGIGYKEWRFEAAWTIDMLQ